MSLNAPGREWGPKFLSLDWLASKMKMLILAPRAQATLSVDGALHLPVLLIPLLLLAVGLRKQA